jgi:hypothetical protein
MSTVLSDLVASALDSVSVCNACATTKDLCLSTKLIPVQQLHLIMCLQLAGWRNFHLTHVEEKVMGTLHC